MSLSLHPRFLFPGQQPHERVYLLTRPHWFIIAKRLLLWSVFAALLIIFDQLAEPVMPLLSEPPYLQLVSLIKTLYLMFLLAGLFAVWIIYYLNFQIVTDRRIVDIDQRGLLHHQTSELNLINVEDVTAELSGLAGTLFNFGHVYVQTAGRITQFEFDNIPNPHKVAKLILDLYEKQTHNRLNKHDHNKFQNHSRGLRRV